MKQPVATLQKTPLNLKTLMEKEVKKTVVQMKGKIMKQRMSCLPPQKRRRVTRRHQRQSFSVGTKIQAH
eukprot:5211458-Ditylum_brightwellii.AAC.1